MKRKPCRQKIRKARITERIKEDLIRIQKKYMEHPKITRNTKKEEGEKISEKYVGSILRETILKLIISNHIQ
ncbi:MAG: hypothetical protein ACLTAI_08085 [Thomasclavelia sp.]